MPVSLKKIMVNLETALKAVPTTGFGLAIYQAGELKRSTSSGWAVYGVRPMKSTTRIGMHSAGKTLTAAAIVHALETQGKSVLDPIGPYLPTSWKRGPNIEAVTFAMLLTHTAGIMSEEIGYDGLRKVVAAGVAAPAPVGHDYDNSNYALCRILLPAIHGLGSAFELIKDQKGLDFYGSWYVNYIQDHILEPSSVHGADLVYTGPPPQVLYYRDVDSPATSEVTPFGRSWAHANAGVGLWNLTPREYARVIDRLRKGVVLPGIWKTMAETSVPTAPWARLGMYVSGPDGSSLNHNGGTDFGFSAWVALPDDITVVFSANSTGPAGEQLIVKAYEDALV